MPALFFEDEGGFYAQLKKKYYYKVELWTTGNKEHQRLIDIADKYLKEVLKPKSFTADNPNNEIVSNENAFEAICAALEDCGCPNPKELTVYEFYKRIEYYKKKFKPKGKK